VIYNFVSFVCRDRRCPRIFNGSSGARPTRHTRMSNSLLFLPHHTAIKHLPISKVFKPTTVSNLKLFLLQVNLLRAYERTLKMSSSNQAMSGISDTPFDKPVQYTCGDCASKVQLKRGDPIRCVNCGHRVLYKERTNR